MSGQATLLHRIEAGATSSVTSVSELLRMCAILAKRLGHQPLAEWVGWELNGYSENLDLPDYRVHPVEVRCQLSGPLQSQATNIPVPQTAFPKEDRDSIYSVRFRDGVGTYEALEGGEGEQLSMPLDQAYVLYHLGDEGVFEGYTTVAAWRVVPKAILTGMLDTIRNKVLMFALEIEGENPEAGEASIGEEPVPIERVQQYFQTIIYGSSNTVAVAGRDIDQRVTSVQPGDWESLREALAILNVPEEDITELKEALVADGPIKGDLGEHSRSWLGKITTKIGKGGLTLAGGVGVEMIAELLLKYAGLG